MRVVIGRSVIQYGGWEKEKEDITGRLDWLCERIVVEPEALMKKMPPVLGPSFGGEWAIYSCTHLSTALLNISRIYPEEKSRTIVLIGKLVEMVLSPELKAYDTRAWGEDALETLSGNKSHMTYLSLLAWVISNYKLCGGDERYDELFHGCCEALNRRMLCRKDLNLPSFPRTPIFIPDMLFTIVSLHNYSIIFDGKYSDTVNRWLAKAKSEWIDKSSGLLVSMITRNGRPVRGSYTALNVYCLTMIDEGFARDQYERMKRTLGKVGRLSGIREYLYKDPFLRPDVDAGIVGLGISGSGTAWAIGGATYFNDEEFRDALLTTADKAGVTVGRKSRRHYYLGELAIVGEAVVLAMRTHVNN